MKKGVLAIAAIAFLGGSLFTSCNKKKDWACECTYKDSGEKFESGKMIGVTKKAAKKACDLAETSLAGTVTCELK